MIKGIVTKIWSDVIEVKFPPKLAKAPQIGDVVLLHEGQTFMVIERIMDQQTVRAISIHIEKEISIGEAAYGTGKKLKVPVDGHAKGKMFNIRGQAMNLGQHDSKIKYIEMDSTETQKIFSKTYNKRVESGIKAIDFFTPIFEGSKLGIFGGAGVGKTVVMKELIFNLTKKRQNTFPIFIGSGERIREGNELFAELSESGLLDNSLMFVAQMNEPAGARMKIVPMGITAAEYHRDNKKENVVLFIDNIFRFAQAGNELSATLGRKPSVGGYQPTLVSEISTIEERLVANENGSITSFQNVFLDADDLTDPAAVAIFSHLDGSIVLSRDIASQGLYPAIDPIASNSNLNKVDLIGQVHFDALFQVKNILQKYKELEDLILILGIDDLQEENKEIVFKALQLQNFFTQNLFSATSFGNKQSGVWVPFEETLESVVRIVRGDYLSRSPEEFAYIGSTTGFLSDEQLKEQKTRELTTSEISVEKEAEKPRKWLKRR